MDSGTRTPLLQKGQIQPSQLGRKLSFIRMSKIWVSVAFRSCWMVRCHFVWSLRRKLVWDLGPRCCPDPCGLLQDHPSFAFLRVRKRVESASPWLRRRLQQDLTDLKTLRIAFDMLLSRGHDNAVQAHSDVFHAHRTASQNSEARPGARLSRTCSLPRPRQRRLPRYPWRLLTGSAGSCLMRLHSGAQPLA